MIHQAIQAFQNGNLNSAEIILDRVLAAHSKNLPALHILGLIKASQSKHKEAAELLKRAIRLNPSDPSLHYNLAKALQESGADKESLPHHKKAVELNPTNPEAWLNYGRSLSNLGLNIDALDVYKNSLQINPNYTEAFLNIGATLKDLDRYDEAINYADKALSINPTLSEAWSNRGIALKELKRYDEALASYDQAISLKPDYHDAWSNKGVTLGDLKRYDEALASYNQAISLKPDYHEAWFNRGVTLNELKRYDEALASYDQAISLKPEYAEAYNNRGIIRLSLRNFQQGFADCGYRWKSKDFPSKPQKTTLPSCAETGLKGHLLIWAEQGIGDEIFYASLLPTLATREVSITLSADKRLHPIYKRSFPKIDIIDKEILLTSSVDTGFDAQSPIGDLGYLLGVDEAAIKATRSPYLKGDTTRRDDICKVIAGFGSGITCGIAWKSTNKQFGADKSISLSSFEALLCSPGIQFVNLQYGDVKDEIQQVKSKFLVDIHQVPNVDVFQDLDGLLALIDACDVIVTTSNVTAHLAGSLGKLAAVLVPYGKGKIWYWHHNDEKSFWYPSLRLFYQDNPLSWNNPIKDCSDWIKALL